MKEDDLKPCPFCGGEPKYLDDPVSRIATIYCRACPCEMALHYGARDDRGKGPIMERWNGRAV